MGGRALVARPSFPLQLFPSNGSARDGCRYVAIEALFLRGEIGLRLFPLLLPLTRDSLPSRLMTCPKRARSQKEEEEEIRYTQHAQIQAKRQLSYVKNSRSVVALYPVHWP